MYKNKLQRFSAILTVIYLSVILGSCSRTEEKADLRNVILMIGDGMGVTQIYAGMTANNGSLTITESSHIGFIKTNSFDNYTTDSAAGGTAIAAGVKTRNGMIGMGPDSLPVPSILEIADQHGMSTGLVSTSAITHATPASFIAHQVSRNMYEEIALDFLETDIDVFIGGGRSHFTNRQDGRDLLEELRDRGYSVYDDPASIMEPKADKIAVLTADIHNPPCSEGRGDMLPVATAGAIKVLDSSDDGFFLMVEGSQIDWGGHANNIDYVVDELLDFDRAVKEAVEFAREDGNTLVIVTADHECGGLSLIDGNIETGHLESHFSTGNHTGVMVPVFAFGKGAEEFTGVYENTDIIFKLRRLLGFSLE